MKQKVRLMLSLVIVILTGAVFAHYLVGHTYLFKQLSHTPILVILLLFLLYIVWFGSLVLILQACLRICGKAIKPQENVLLNAYSIFINFFIPGQGGPAMRGIYLKKRQDLPIKSYIFVTLLYYACYAIISAFLLLIGSRPGWTVFGVLMVVIVSLLAVRLYSKRAKTGGTIFKLSPTNLSYLILVTLFQTVLQVAIFAVELHTANAHISVRQSMTYTGAANFALFVGLTPGAIGIRESFLFFSQHLHHISSANIITADVIDRAVFILFLGLLFIFTVGFHVKDRLQLKLND